MAYVKIPTCANPFVVMVNGKRYEYPAGVEMEVPDEVAHVIETHYKAEQGDPSPEVQPPFGCGSSGGAGSGKLVVEFNMESHNPTYGGNVECNMDYASLRDAMLSGNDVDVRLTNKGNDKFNYLYSAPLSLCFYDPSDGASPKIGASGVVSYRKSEYSVGAGIVCIEYTEYGEISLSVSEVTFN